MNVELNNFGVNKKIEICDDIERLIHFGFSEQPKCLSIPEHLHWHRFFTYKGLDISFNIDYYYRCKYKGDRLDISVLDEDFCQPYDYQYILETNCNNEYALRVKDFVESTMDYLQINEILSGHQKGEYI